MQKIPKWRGSRHFGKITGQYSRPQFHLPPLGSFASWRTWRHLVAKVGMSKRGGKQWKTTPKNLPRMQCTRATPVAWLSSGICPNRSKGWIPIIIIINNNNNNNNNGATVPSGPGPSHYRGLPITHSGILHSVGLLWTSDQPEAETSTWQQTTLTWDRRQRRWRDSNPQSQQASGRLPTP